MIAKGLALMGTVLVGQFICFWLKHHDDGGGNDGGMGSALLSIAGAAIGLAFLATAGLCAAFAN